MLELHIKGTAALTVTDEVTAAAVGSGMLPVFATPSMIALMEKAAAESVAPQLDAGMTDADAFALLAENGMLVKRPIVVGEDFVLVGFREAEWEKALL